jgi:hypothetical protein
MKRIDNSEFIEVCGDCREKPLPRGIRPAQLTVERLTGKQKLL